ncbi:MAG: WecB/TagA/CpsF family glycosyltransferase [Cyanobacteria bacterium P01_D01_bin.36]
MNSRKIISKRKAFREAVLTSQARQLQHYERNALKKRVSILNVGIDNFSAEEFLNRLQKGVVFTPNVDHLMKLQKDPEFVQAYRAADFKVCDSQILMYAAKFLGTPIRAKISGSDLVPLFCDRHRDNENIKIFMLGGAKGVPERARRNINARIGREIVVAAHSPSFGFEQDEAECQRILDMIRASSANVLMVGVGAPKQEKWIAKYRNQLPNIDIFMAVGAAIDFEAGNKPRAPQMISHLGLEWLYRLMSEPRRLWKRYLLQDMPFLWLLLRQKLTGKQS